MAWNGYKRTRKYYLYKQYIFFVAHYYILLQINYYMRYAPRDD